MLVFACCSFHQLISWGCAVLQSVGRSASCVRNLVSLVTVWRVKGWNVFSLAQNGLVTNSFARSNEYLCSTEGKEFLEQLSNCQIQLALWFVVFVLTDMGEQFHMKEDYKSLFVREFESLLVD
jgi:hypothetical protein